MFDPHYLKSVFNLKLEKSAVIKANKLALNVMNSCEKD